MSPKGSHVVKVRVTASFDPAVVRTIDTLAKVTGHSSRSRLIEEALRHWIAEQRRRDLEQQVEAYYLSLSKDEREEDREWAEGASHDASVNRFRLPVWCTPTPPVSQSATASTIWN